MTSRTRQRATKAKAPTFRTARFALGFRPSEIEGFGVYAKEDIPVQRLVIEYTGEKITLKEKVRRSTRMMRSRGPKRAYWFCFYCGHRRYVLDGSVDGSGAEYINHSCDPNLFTRRANCCLLLYSRRVIQTGEELTLDYRYSPESERVECRCGSPKCRGTINRLKWNCRHSARRGARGMETKASRLTDPAVEFARGTRMRFHHSQSRPALVCLPRNR